MNDWVVLKFGGTSVAGAGSWATIARLAAARRAEGHSVLLVCSAPPGITDRLDELASENTTRSDAAVAAIVDRFAMLATGLGVTAGDLLEGAGSRLSDLARAASEAGVHPAARAELLAEGELLCSRIGARFLAATTEARWIDPRPSLRVLPEEAPDSPRAWWSARCQPGPEPGLAERWREVAPLLLAPGFVATAPDGRTALLGRGGSDTSAALLAGRLGARRIEIWTDVAGVFSADPRQVADARLLPRLEHGEALELAAGGARVVHPRALHAAAATGTEVWVRDSGNPSATGTVITATPARSPGVRALSLQHDMAVLLLENRDIRQQVGFLSGVFAVIARNGISVDLVATSETTTTLAIHRPANHLDDAALERLSAELAATCRVTVHARADAVHLVGRGARANLARLAPLAGWLERHPVYLVSQSANDLCLSLLVPEGAGGDALAALHAALVAGQPVSA